MKTRSYSQFCALAFALDVVGERWSLLIVRELLPGPRRFKDLLEGLPGISTNLLSERLKSLEQEGVLCRRVLPPPAGSTVYELTPAGQALETAVLELGKWGSRRLPSSPDGIALPSLGAISLALKAFFHPEQARGVSEIYELRFGAEALAVEVRDGELHVRQGQVRQPAAVIHTDMPTFLGLFTGQLKPAEALAGELIRVEGDSEALSRFLRYCFVAGPSNEARTPTHG
jgi:DNA-binding HxlR family transcriptional regulator/putative sterol carrier protein